MSLMCDDNILENSDKTRIRWHARTVDMQKI